MIKWKTFYSGWAEVTEYQARMLVKHFYRGAVAIPADKKESYINTNLLQGITVKELLN